MSFERLQDQIREMKNPTVAGLDPKLEYVPAFILEEKLKEYGETTRAAAEAIYAYNVGLIDALYDVVPAVKPQSAFYERFGFEGVEALKRTVDYAKSKGLYVIMDAKRGDIGSTAEGYSDAYLGAVKIGNTEVEPFGCDCLTINAYLGSDGTDKHTVFLRYRQLWYMQILHLCSNIHGVCKLLHVFHRTDLHNCKYEDDVQ